ncbi:hypothetical protein XENTR_v10007851 [Xenopus tropicalis]|nr:hypothetical protein XENTR_v10007851 [Xenopus tropicalis]
MDLGNKGLGYCYQCTKLQRTRKRKIQSIKKKYKLQRTRREYLRNRNRRFRRPSITIKILLEKNETYGEEATGSVAQEEGASTAHEVAPDSGLL